MRILRCCLKSQQWQVIGCVLLFLLLAPGVLSAGDERDYYATTQIPNQLILKIRLTDAAMPDNLSMFDFNSLSPQLFGIIKKNHLVKTTKILLPTEDHALPSTAVSDLNYFHLTFQDSLDFAQIIPFLEKSERILRAEPNYIFSFSKTEIQNMNLVNILKKSKSKRMDSNRDEAFINLTDSVVSLVPFDQIDDSIPDTTVPTDTVGNSAFLKIYQVRQVEVPSAEVPQGKLIKPGSRFAEFEEQIIQPVTESNFPFKPVAIQINTADYVEAIIDAVTHSAKMILLPPADFNNSFLFNAVVAFASRRNCSIITREGKMFRPGDAISDQVSKDEAVTDSLRPITRFLIREKEQLAQIKATEISLVYLASRADPPENLPVIQGTASPIKSEEETVPEILKPGESVKTRDTDQTNPGQAMAENHSIFLKSDPIGSDTVSQIDSSLQKINPDPVDLVIKKLKLTTTDSADGFKSTQLFPDEIKPVLSDTVKTVTQPQDSSEQADESDFLKVPNAAPVFLKIFPGSDTTLVENDSLRFAIIVLDPENDSLRFEWRSFRKKTLSHAGTLFKYSVPGFNLGVDTIQVTVSDNDTSISRTWLVKIKKENVPPVFRTLLPAANSFIEVQDSLEISVSVFDENHDQLIYYWYFNGEVISDHSDSTFRYNSYNFISSRDTIQVLVSDGEFAITNTWLIKNSRKPVVPQIISLYPGSQVVRIAEGDSIPFKVNTKTISNFDIQYTWIKGDSIYAWGVPENSYAFFWNFDEAGLDTISVQISNKDTTIIQRWQIYISNVNQPPQIISRFPTADTSLVIGDSLSFSVLALEPDSQKITLNWYFNGRKDSSAHNLKAYHLMTGDLNPGVDTLQVFIADGDTTISNRWLIHIRRPNHAPEITYFWPTRDTSLVEGDSLFFMARAIDADGDSIRSFWKINGDSVFTPSRSTLFYKARFDGVGMDSIEFRVFDQKLSTAHKWSIAVRNINYTPGTPRPLRPVNGESVFESDSLIWRAAMDSDFEDSLLTYCIEVAEDTGFTMTVSIDSVVGDTSLALKFCSGFQLLHSGKTYFWRLKAFDQYHDSSGVQAGYCRFRLIKLSAKISNAYANTNADGSVTILWETIFEEDNLGFNILRKTLHNGNYTRLNDVLIQGSSPYSFVDTDVNSGETYFYCIESVSVNGIRLKSKVISVAAPVPETFVLNQNYPNPLTSETLIHYEIPRMCTVKIQVYNILGKVVRTLVNQKVETGFHQVIWDGRDDTGNEVGSGIYFYTIHAEKFRDTKKIMVVR